MQIQLLQKYLGDIKLHINQLQLSITNTGIIDSGLNVNTEKSEAVDRDGYILDFCRLNDITIQPWSPLQYGFIAGNFVDNKKYKSLNKVIEELAEKYGLKTIEMAGFLDGINDSLVEANPIDDMEEDTEVSLKFDKALLYKNMVAGDTVFCQQIIAPTESMAEVVTVAAKDLSGDIERRSKP